MEYVEPIKEIRKINEIKKILDDKSDRDLLLFVLGINTGVRVCDLLKLKVEGRRMGLWKTQRISFCY
ncbi:hypothetical protein [Halalkalibacter okhensis]|uniref:hypothetical protein n=1 Tax=Halalkalibacter okhensis TaxID=333138 RepID=UPI000B09E652|nr:hypothetical protein [Halalkalibacter okhensis]